MAWRLESVTACLMTPERVFLRGSLGDCLAVWAALPAETQAKAYVEFPTMTAGRYSLHAGELRALSKRRSL